MFRYFRCMVTVFQSSAIQSSLSSISETLHKQILQIYQYFLEINDRADALKEAFRTVRATQFLFTVRNFQDHFRIQAENVMDRLTSPKK